MRLLLVLALAPLAARAESGRPNLLLISLGNVGAGRMSLYGYARPTTPGLERWAKDAVVFEDARAPASWTLPVAATVMTGLAPRAHGLQSRIARNRLDGRVPTLAERLRARGWSTGAFAGGLDYDDVFGHMRGFDVRARNMNFEALGLTVSQAGRWLNRRARPPFFAFVHGYDAHCPFIPTTEFRGSVSGSTVPPAMPAGVRCGRAVDASTGPIRISYAVEWCLDLPDCPVVTVDLTPELETGLMGAYDDTVRQADDRVSRFIDSIPRDVMANTVVVVFGDHGEMFSKNGRFGRVGPNRGVFYDDVLRVPLIIKAPGLAPGRVRGPVELASLPATLLELLGAASPMPGAAPSLVPAMRAGRAELGPAFSGMDVIGGDGPYAGRARGGIDAVVDGRWKLIRETTADGRASVELYDLEKDPGETRDLARRRPKDVRRLEALIVERAARDAAAAVAPGEGAVREDIRRAARLYGYW